VRSATGRSTKRLTSTFNDIFYYFPIVTVTNRLEIDRCNICQTLMMTFMYLQRYQDNNNWQYFKYL
jgi:hypothetical protein